MLTLVGKSRRFCDGLSRRGFLQVGAVGLSGLASSQVTLADVLRADAAAGANPGRVRRPKSIINICLPGGPTHLDTFDLKPGAPAEVRGELNPIATVVPGFEICELMPRLAKVADKIAVVRSISDFSNEHTTRQADSGWPEKSLMPMGGRPGIGAVASKLLGPSAGCPVTSVSLANHTSPGYLGQSLKDFQPDTAARNTLKLRMPEERLHDRQALLSSLDKFQRSADNSGSMKALDRFTQDAIDVVTSPKFSEALEFEREPASTWDRYGDRQATGRFVTARRLIEAGVRIVSMTFGGWDTHQDNFKTMRRQLPQLDAGLSGLIYDLEERGMLEDTLIMMSGEFGRTPRINGGAGRDHWPGAGFVFLAGGGFRMGQAIGATDRTGSKPVEHPIHLQQVFAMAYRNLGIDVDSAPLADANGRPQYLVDYRDPITELL